MTMDMPNNSESGHPRRRDITGGLTLVLGLAAAGLVLYSTSQYGVGVSPDSTVYLATAQNLRSGNGYVSHDGTLYTAQPPLFPTLLAALGLVEIKPVVAARLLNALAMGAIVFVSAGLCARHIKSTALFLIATLSAVFSLPLLSVSVMAWTEPVFVLLIVLFLRQMAAFLRQPTYAALVKGAVLAALCSLQRYTGVTAILTGAVVLWLPFSQGSMLSRLKRFLWFGFLACAPLGVWAIRSYRLTSTWSGSRRIPSCYSLEENVKTALDTLTRWFSPGAVPLSIRVIAVALVVLLAVAALFFHRHRARQTKGQDDLDMWPAGLFILIYLPLMTYTHQVGVYDEIMNDRYLSPVFIPIVWLVFMGLDRARMLLAAGSKKRRLSEAIVAGLCALWLFYPIAQTQRLVASWTRHGTGGYSTAAWRQSGVIDWLRNHPLDGRVYTNMPDALYSLADIHATVSPHRGWDLAPFQATVPSTPATYLVWFSNRNIGYLHGIEVLMSALCLEECATLSDGSIYRLVPSADRGGLKGRVFSRGMVDGVWHRSFTSETFGPAGLIRSWFLRADGTTDGIWELKIDNGTVLTWHPHGRYEHSDDTFEFSCDGQASENRNHTAWPYVFHVQGSVDDLAATGTYHIEFTHPSSPYPDIDRGTWRVDLARPVYRLWSSTSNRHLYTIDRKQVDELTMQSSNPWKSEGVAFCAYLPGQQPPEARPVYDLLARTSGEHLYTIQEREKTKLLSDSANTWGSEGIAFYAYAEDSHPADTRPVYRFWAATPGEHFYTMDETERDALITKHANVWTYEGIAWYALASQRP